MHVYMYHTKAHTKKGTEQEKINAEYMFGKRLSRIHSEFLLNNKRTGSLEIKDFKDIPLKNVHKWPITA